MGALILSTILFAGGLIIVYWLHNQYQLELVVQPAAPPLRPPLISVCVPARNEARNIRECVQAILAQTYAEFELIVVDDCSTDSTARILEGLELQDSRLRWIEGADLPAGWAGKPYALFQAAGQARGEWLCFIDADTFLNPGALSACFAKANETGADLFTIMTRQVTGSFWERVVMPLVLTALSVGFSPRKVNDPGRTDAIANGQFILIKRSVYLAVGGHQRIKDQIVEDKALAEQVKWNGYRLIVADGTGVARTRMYTSFPTLWEGWTKNIYLGLRDQRGLLLLGALGAFVSVIAALFMPAWPLLGALWYLRGGGWGAGLVVIQALIVWAALIYARVSVADGLKIPRWYALTTPLGAAVFAAMMLTSTWIVLSGKGVTWRGRRYTP